MASLRRAAGYNLLDTAGAVMVVVRVCCALFAPWIALEQFESEVLILG